MSKITALPPAGPITGAETVPMVQDGAMVQAPLEDAAAPTIAKAQAWAEGTMPGGEGTKSAKEWVDQIDHLLKPKKNLFDKASMVRNGKRYSPASDQVITDANGKCTTFIPVVPGQQIAISGGESGFTGGWFATASDTGTATDLGFATGATSLVATVPADRFFLVVNLTLTNSSAAIDTLQIEVGAAPTAYAPYQLGLAADQLAGLLSPAQIEGLPDAFATLEDINAIFSGLLTPKKNLADPSKIIAGKYYSPGSNAIASSTSYRMIGPIPVIPGATYTVSGVSAISAIAASTTSSQASSFTNLGNTAGGVKTVTIPAGSAYLWVNLTGAGQNDTTYDGTVQIEEGSAVTSYEAYTLIVGTDKVKNSAKWPVMVSETGTNLIDPSKINYVKRYSTGFKAIQNDELGIAASDWIAVEEGQTYTLSGAGAYNITGTPQGGYFTAYGNLTAPSNITWFDTPNGNGKSFTVPTGQGITHVVVSLRKLNDLVASTTLHGPVQLQEGEYATAWEAFEIRDVVSEANLPKSVTGGGAGTSSVVVDDAAWLRYVGGEGVPTHLDKWPVFRRNYLEKKKDMNVVVLGTSLGARTTEHHSDHPQASRRPPLLHSLNLASHIWDKIAWQGQAYARYDASGEGTEPTGTWATSFNLAEWDDGGFRNGLTRYCADAGCSFTRQVPAGAFAWRLIYRSDSVAPTVVTVGVSGGNNQMQVYDEGTAAWVEANGYTFSQREAAPTTRSVSIPNPDTDAFASSTIASKGNTTYQKRLRFRCKWTGVDTRATAKTITFTSTSGGRLNYWGHEWSHRPVMITLINAARGSHNTQATQSTGLPRFADNEVHSFKPDLIYMELPIHNDGAAGIAQYATWDRWGRLTNNYVWRADYELSLMTRAAFFGYTPEIGMWTPSIAYGFGGIGEDGQLLFSDQTDGTPMSALDKFDQAAAWVAQNKPDTVFVNAVRRWVEAAFAIYGDLKTATATTGKAGPGMTNDGGHPNDIGDRILAKVVCGPLCFEK